ncbi:MAG: hypothetical protein OXF43_12220 [Gammaproteobacteria bacterium]|nr:hypothetical protein [Gammaproteobacteria bacterium]
MRFTPIVPLIAGLLAAGQVEPARAHGSVALEDDLCVIDIDFLTAHFTIFQPETRGAEEFCEDVPEAARSVFIMEYLHELLEEMRVDFRIIRDDTGIGRFADWNDILAMGDLEPLTVHYQAPSIEPSGYFRASHEFSERGSYIGIVTASHPTEARDYRAVFYFQVGRNWGSFPLFIALIAIAQLGYWAANGRWRRLGKRTPD